MKTRFLLVAVAALAAVAATPAAADLTAVSFGGTYGAAQKKHMLDPFMEATGIKVVFKDYSGGIAEIRAQVEAKNVQWDVVDIEGIDLDGACSKGLLEVLPHDALPPGDDGVPARDDFFPEALASKCGVGVVVWTTLYAYHPDTVRGGIPTTIGDFFDTSRFPGKRAMRKRPQVNLEWALIADGVPREQVYDLLATDRGQARAFAKLDTIKDDLVWYDSWSQAPQLLNDGSAVLVQASNGRIFRDVQDHGRPFVMVWDHHVFDLDVWAIVAGTPNYDQALEFVKFATGTKPLAGMQDLAYSPARRSSLPLVDPAVVGHLPTAHLDKGLKADGVFWMDFGESLGEKFKEWLLK